MNTPSEHTTFKGSQDSRKFFYLYENIVTENLPHSERAEKNVAYLSDSAFEFYFDRFSLANAPTEEAKDYGLAKKVMLEKFSTQNTESEIMREALTFRYGRRDIPTFLSRAQPRQAPKQVEAVCYKYGEKGHYTLQCRMEQALVINVVRKVTELLSVARRPAFHLGVHIATASAALQKTVMSRGATKQSKSKI